MVLFIHIASGGGGATLKPFADWRGVEERSAPEWAMNALAVRALTHHFVFLEISLKSIVGKTFQVCAKSTKKMTLDGSQKNLGGRKSGYHAKIKNQSWRK